jgi:hypothetical protein
MQTKPRQGHPLPNKLFLSGKTPAARVQHNLHFCKFDEGAFVCERPLAGEGFSTISNVAVPETTGLVSVLWTTVERIRHGCFS